MPQTLIEWLVVIVLGYFAFRIVVRILFVVLILLVMLLSIIVVPFNDKLSYKLADLGWRMMTFRTGDPQYREDLADL